jgi:hypothetical protein
MKTRNFTIAVATGMAFAVSAFAADSSSATGMQTQHQAKQQQRSSSRAPGQQAVAPAQTTAPAGAVTGADFDRQTKSVSQSLQRGELSIAATESTATTRGAGAAGSPGQLLGRGGQLTDTGSAWFDGYVDQVNRQLRMSEPAYQ